MSSLLGDVKKITLAVDHMAEACYVLSRSNDWVGHDAMQQIEGVMDVLVARCKELEDIEHTVKTFFEEQQNAR